MDDHDHLETMITIVSNAQPTPATGREAIIEIVVEGVVIRVPSGVDEATLALVLQTLKSLR
jgi:transposase